MAKPKEQIFVSAILAEAVETGADGKVSIRNLVRCDLPEASLGQLVHVKAKLFVTILFKNPRPGGHAYRVVLRDQDGVERLAYIMPTIEQVKHDETTARIESIDWKFPPRLHYLCVEIDGADRAVWPLWPGAEAE